MYHLTTEEINKYVISNEFSINDYIRIENIDLVTQIKIKDSNCIEPGRERKTKSIKFIYTKIEDYKSFCNISDCGASLISKNLYNLYIHLKGQNKEKAIILLHILEKTLPKKSFTTIIKPQQSIGPDIQKTVTLKISLNEFQKHIQLIILCGSTFISLESKYYRMLTHHINKSLNFFPNRHNIKKLITNKYNNLTKFISELFKEELLNIPIDGAIRKYRKFISINIHAINDHSFNIINLGMVELHQPATAVHLKHVIMEVLRRYNLDYKNMLSLTSDNGENIIKTAYLILDHIQENNLDDDVDINDSNINGYVMPIQKNYINNNMNIDKKDIYSDAIDCYEYY